MGRFSVPLEVANFFDVMKADAGELPKNQVRKISIQGTVDSGAARLVIPQSVAKQLGLKASGKVNVRYADHRRATRNTAREVFIELQGRSGVFTAIIEPKRVDVLIGAIVLEDLDFLIDCLHQRLVPRDPRFVISEIE